MLFFLKKNRLLKIKINRITKTIGLSECKKFIPDAICFAQCNCTSLCFNLLSLFIMSLKSVSISSVNVPSF